jgi:DNA repair exonuclease SbcCD nuclease subunit
MSETTTVKAKRPRKSNDKRSPILQLASQPSFTGASFTGASSTSFTSSFTGSFTGSFANQFSSTQFVCSDQQYFLIIGDPHFKTDNVEASIQFTIQVEKCIQQLVQQHSNNFVAIIILGDILHYHEKIYTTAMNVAVTFMKMCSQYRPTYCLVGNHDATNNSFYCSTNHWMNVLHNLHQQLIIVDKPKWIPNTRVLLCPYTSDGRFMEMLNEFTAQEWQQAHMICAHQSFDGAKIGALMIENIESWPADAPYIVSGHIHEKQQVQPNLLYVGSSQQTSFAETDDKTLCLININTSLSTPSINHQSISLDVKRNRIIRCSVAELNNNSISIFPNHIYKIVVVDDESIIKTFKKSSVYKQLNQVANIKSIQFKPIVSSSQHISQNEQHDFLSILLKKIQKEADPYLTSYANHLITNSEDISDKSDVVVME